MYNKVAFWKDRNVTKNQYFRFRKMFFFSASVVQFHISILFEILFIQSVASIKTCAVIKLKQNEIRSLEKMCAAEPEDCGKVDMRVFRRTENSKKLRDRENLRRNLWIRAGIPEEVWTLYCWANPFPTVCGCSPSGATGSLADSQFPLRSPYSPPYCENDKANQLSILWIHSRKFCQYIKRLLKCIDSWIFKNLLQHDAESADCCLLSNSCFRVRNP